MKVKIYLLLLYLINLAIALNNDNYHDLNNEPVGIENLNPISNLEESCSHYLDCHNCTVARCFWEDNHCLYPEHYENVFSEDKL